MDIFGTVAAAIQLGETIYDLGKRIRKKPKDTKAVEVIVADAKKAVTSLRQWEAQMPPEVTQACRELRGKLQEIIDDVEGLKKKNLFKKMFTSLKLYHPEFLQQFSKSLALFQFHIGAQNQLAIGDVNGKLDSLKEEMKILTISSELLPEGITGLDGKVAEIQDEIQRLSEMMDGFKLLEETRREAVSSCTKSHCSYMLMVVEARERLLTWIFGGIIDATHSSVKRRRADSSGEWLLNHPAFKEWESASNSAMILYCKGQRIFVPWKQLNSSWRRKNVSNAMHHYLCDSREIDLLSSIIWRLRKPKIWLLDTYILITNIHILFSRCLKRY